MPLRKAIMEALISGNTEKPYFSARRTEKRHSIDVKPWIFPNMAVVGS